MIKLKDAVEKYGEYEIDEKKLENILVKPKPKTVWDIKLGCEYWYIDSLGSIKSCRWLNSESDNKRRNFCNMFLTYEEAEFEAERRKVEAELIKLGGTRDMMSLGDENVYKYFMVYDMCAKGIYTYYYYSTNHLGQIFFKTKGACQSAIQEIGEDRIKKYIFNVKE